MIYAIFDNQYMKIGYSKHPEKRLQQLQTAHPQKLKLIKVWQGEKWMEKRIHYILKPLSINYNHEWFRLTPNDLGIIDRILSKCQY